MGAALETAVSGNAYTYRCSTTTPAIANCFIQTVFSGAHICSVCYPNMARSANVKTCTPYTDGSRPNCVNFMLGGGSIPYCTGCKMGYALNTSYQCITYNHNNCLVHGIFQLTGVSPKCLYCRNGYYLDGNSFCRPQTASLKGCFRAYNGNGNTCVQCDYFNGYIETSAVNGVKVCVLASTVQGTGGTVTKYTTPVNNNNKCGNVKCAQCFRPSQSSVKDAMHCNTCVGTGPALVAGVTSCTGAGLPGCFATSLTTTGKICALCNNLHTKSADSRSCTPFSTATFPNCAYARVINGRAACIGCKTKYVLNTNYQCVLPSANQNGILLSCKVYGLTSSGKLGCLMCNSGNTQDGNGGCYRSKVRGCMLMQGTKCVVCDYPNGFFETSVSTTGAKTCSSQSKGSVAVFFRALSSAVFGVMLAVLVFWN